MFVKLNGNQVWMIIHFATHSETQSTSETQCETSVMASNCARSRERAMWHVDSAEESGVNVVLLTSAWTLLAAGYMNLLEPIGYSVSKFEAFTTKRSCKCSLLQVWTPRKFAHFSALRTSSGEPVCGRCFFYAVPGLASLIALTNERSW